LTIQDGWLGDVCEHFFFVVPAKYTVQHDLQRARLLFISVITGHANDAVVREFNDIAHHFLPYISEEHLDVSRGIQILACKFYPGSARKRYAARADARKLRFDEPELLR